MSSITGEQLIRKHNLQDFDIVDFINKEQLCPLDRFGRPTVINTIIDEIRSIINEKRNEAEKAIYPSIAGIYIRDAINLENYIKKIHSNNMSIYDLPDNQSLCERIIKILKYAYYRVENTYSTSITNTNNLNSYDTTPLDGQERREYGIMKTMAHKQDIMLQATCYAMQFCFDHQSNGKITKDELFNALRSEFKDLPESAYEKIRLAIRDQFPGKYIKEGGRPLSKNK